MTPERWKRPVVPSRLRAQARPNPVTEPPLITVGNESEASLLLPKRQSVIILQRGLYWPIWPVRLGRHHDAGRGTGCEVALAMHGDAGVMATYDLDTSPIAKIFRRSKTLEEAVTGGITAAALVDEPAERTIWRAELEKISLPILASLRDLTEKPRRIEELRGEIEPGVKTHGQSSGTVGPA